MRAFVFPGQGSQFLGMFSPFLDFQEFFSFISEIRKLDLNLIDAYENGPEDVIKETRYSQPAIFSISSMLDYFLKNRNFKPDYVAGHSLGEYSAFYSAGIFDFTKGLLLVYERGKIMQEISKEVSGGMWAVIGGDREEILESLKHFENLWVANYNSLDQMVLTGDTNDFNKWQEKMKDKVKKIVALAVSGPFHSPLMKKAQDRFYEFLKDISFCDPQIPVISSTTKEEVKKGKEAKEILLLQFTSSVFWTDVLFKLNNLGVCEFIEVGPGKVLQGLIKKTLPLVKILGIEKPQDFEKIQGGE
ncbi:MAG: ACP S-malonyltransferase [Dictyoglomus sp.]|nr:ACP S-malonyltransferase [Dictyoglomus sp.]MCX7942401.1 ACP S-malonyltransferase [Dictyoglomaceae bacterium]MDW8188938.1 ACP S-malonyltransferase [Dictyoglomus sp.]